MIVSLAVGSAAAVLLALCAGAASYGAAALALPRAPTSARLSAAVLAAWWLLVVLFYPLAWAGMFDRPAALVVLALLAAALVAGARRHGLDLRSLAIADVHRIGVALRDCSKGTPGLPLIATGVLLATYLVRGLVSPPLAWDALTYHLVHAARWVQHGGFAPQAAPDAWGYYEFFPYAGDILWAWAMVPVGGDALLAPAGAFVVLALGLASYAAARSLELTRDRAALVALAVLSTPAVVAFTNSAYVDNTALACFALGCLFLARATRERSSPDAVLCAIALGLSAAVKPSGLAVFAAGLIALAAALLPKRTVTPLTAPKLAAIATLAALPWLLQAIPTWFHTGSPFYPVSLSLFGRRLLAGNPQLEQLLSGKLFLPEGMQARTPFFLAELFLPTGTESPHLNFGPAGAVFVVLGMAGAWRLILRAETRLLAAFLSVSAAATVAMILSPEATGLRLLWAEVSGRLVAPALLASVLAGATLLPSSAGDRLWRILILISLWFSIPAGISFPEAVAMAALLVAAAALAAGLRYGRHLVPPAWRGREAGLAAALLGVVLFGAGVGSVRSALRTRVYAAAVSGDSFVLHRLHPFYASAWPIWQRLDEMEGQRLAVSSGWDGIGHNAYRYPLFGAHLQHEVVYVTPTCSGEVVDYEQRTSLLEAADFRCWLRHLIDADVDLVVVLAPKNTPESVWLEDHPGVFERLVEGATDQSLAARLDRDAARRLLAHAADPAPASSSREAGARSLQPRLSAASLR